MPFMSFKIVNAKKIKKIKFNKKKKLKYGVYIQWDFNNQLTHRDI